MRHIYFILIIVLITACKKENNSDIDSRKFIAEIISGNNQNGLINQELDSIIYLKVIDINDLPYQRAKITFLTSNGLLVYNYGSKNGVYAIRWFLSCNEGVQNASLIISDSLDRLIDTIKISANALKGQLWNRACGLPLRFQDSEFIFPSILQLIEHPDGTLYLITESYSQGLYFSNDNGESWSKKNSVSDLEIYSLAINENGTYFLSGSSSLYKSFDGESWNLILNKGLTDCFVLDNKTLFVCELLHHFIYRSDNEGQTWDTISITYTNRYNVLAYTESIRKVKRIDSDRILLLNSDRELLISKDNGSTWKIFENTTSFGHLSDFILKDNNIYIVEYYGAQSIPQVYKSNLDNVSWSLLFSLSQGEFRSYKDNLFFVEDNFINIINENGVASKIGTWVNNDQPFDFLISNNNDYLVVGARFSNKQTGVYYCKINVP